MKGIVVYDSNYGNTKIVAAIIARELGRGIKAVSVKTVKNRNLSGIDLIVVGSPINAWNSTAAIRQFLESLGKYGLTGVKAAAFDTRFKSVASGNAANKISNALENAGAEVVVDPKGFYVDEKEGPLLPEEFLKVSLWAKEIKLKSGFL